MGHRVIPADEASLSAAIERRLRERMAQAAPVPDAKTSLIRARGAVRKVDLHGRRGITLLSIDEIEAMAIWLVVLGLKPYAAPEGVTETTKGATS